MLVEFGRSWHHLAKCGPIWPGRCKSLWSTRGPNLGQCSANVDRVWATFPLPEQLFDKICATSGAFDHKRAIAENPTKTPDLSCDAAACSRAVRPARAPAALRAGRLRCGRDTAVQMPRGGHPKRGDLRLGRAMLRHQRAQAPFCCSPRSLARSIVVFACDIWCVCASKPTSLHAKLEYQSLERLYQLLRTTSVAQTHASCPASGGGGICLASFTLETSLLVTLATNHYGYPFHHVLS